MAKRAFKSQASSARAASSTFGASPAFGAPQAGFQTTASHLSYITEQPDLSAVSDPQIVVALKNLGKKDSTTKAKALEELQEHISTTTIETPVLDAWTNLYPRTSIDNSRRVRQLAHNLQGWITTSSGKRVLPYLPKIIGSWLAGTYDSDRGVARSANDALQAAFPTPEKRDALWNVYRQSILDYVEDAMLVQTQQTLSDERTTTPDDSEAKHVRVVSTAAFVLLQLIKRDFEGVSAKTGTSTKYSKLFSNEKLWEYAYHKDPSMRRAAYALILPTVTNLEQNLDFTVISSCFLSKALQTNQIGSSQQYVEALLFLTEHRPQLWTTDYTSKASSSRRLLQFLKKGSQRGPESFWTTLGQLLRMIPAQAWSRELSSNLASSSLKDAELLLEALHEGVTNSEEPRQNALAAWSMYAGTALWQFRNFSDEEAQTLFEGQIYPILENYISTPSSDTRWIIPAAHSLQICSRILVSLGSSDYESYFKIIWNKLSSNLVHSVMISLPESSKEFRSSQDAVITKAERLFKLHEQVARSISAESSVHDTLNDILTRTMKDCIKTLRDRKGKPYGAAGTIAAALTVLSADKDLPLIEDFLAADLSSLLGSASGSILVTILLRCRSYTNFPTCFDATTRKLLEEHDVPNREELLTRLIYEASPSDLARMAGLLSHVSENLKLALDGNLQKWNSVLALLGNKQLPSHYEMNGSTTGTSTSGPLKPILDEMMAGLLIEEKQTAALIGFQKLISDNTSKDRALSTEVSAQLLPKLLVASDSPNEETARIAAELSSKVQSLMINVGSSNISSTTSQLLQQQFEGETQLISVFGMVEIAEQALKGSDEAQRPELISTLLPSSRHWQSALRPHLTQSPVIESAITSPFQGLVLAIGRDGSKHTDDLARDSDEFSTAMRLAVYVTKLLSSKLIEAVEVKQTETLCLYYPIVLQLINEKITIDASNTLWLSSTSEVIEEAVDVVSTGQKLIRNWIRESISLSEGSVSILGTWSDQLSELQGLSYETYIRGLCYNFVETAFLDMSGVVPPVSEFKTSISAIHRSDDLVKSAALILILQDTLPASTLGKKLFNELVADITELKGSGDTVVDLKPLILLNLFLHEENGLLTSLPKQRLVFLFQNLVRLMESGTASQGLRAEIYKLLFHVAPVVSDVYGDYWEQILNNLSNLWDNEDVSKDLVVVHSSLRLFRSLGLLLPDSNEDLLDAFKAKLSRMEAGLLRILVMWKDIDTGASQPRAITIDLLTRLLRAVEVASLDTTTKLYPLLESISRPVQTSAYELLHRTIPARQEQVSLEVALEKAAVHLPTELLSLIGKAPTVQDWSKFSNTVEIGSARNYLLSWTLAFDHFTNASFKLKEMYHGDIKSSQHMPVLLETICEVLQITSGRPVDASKFDITSFVLEVPDTAKREAQSIAIYLYYQSLLNVPDLVKEWFIEQKNRIKTPLESWTQKHISPLIVAASLETAARWTSTQDPDDRPISIKTSPRASELVASITIDDESPPISLAISLPGAYPLEPAVVTGRNRVGVSDKNWQSWLRTIQIIIFSSGSVIEGLIAFRRNVQGALKGQTECAICYSIIGTDMKTPDKKCATCKNTFHSVCLFRWFRSSNSSSCPLCRNNFNYA